MSFVPEKAVLEARCPALVSAGPYGDDVLRPDASSLPNSDRSAAPANDVTAWEADVRPSPYSDDLVAARANTHIRNRGLGERFDSVEVGARRAG